MYSPLHRQPKWWEGRGREQNAGNRKGSGKKTMKMLKLPETHFESMFYNKSTSTYNNNDPPKWQTVRCFTRYSHTSLRFHFARHFRQHQQQHWNSRSLRVTPLGSFQLVSFVSTNFFALAHTHKHISFASIFSFKFYCTQMTRSFSCFNIHQINGIQTVKISLNFHN